LQDHPIATIGTVKATDDWSLNRYFNFFFYGGRKYSVRLSAAENLQRTYEIANISSEIAFRVPPDYPFKMLKDAYHLFTKGKIGYELCRKLIRVGLNAPTLALPVYEYLVHNRQHIPNARLEMTVFSEQVPDPESRVELADERDALGIPKSLIRWKLSDMTGRT